MNKPIIIGIGELLWDMLPSGKKAGGAPVNFVFHASDAGVESYAISAVGKDPLGDEMMAEVDTVGAGDAFTGAFIAAILQGKSLQEAHRSAVDRSAFVCTQPGAWVTYLPEKP